MQTTMDKLEVGAVFHFSGPANDHPGFVKVSNLYARDLRYNVIRPNATNAADAAGLVVVYAGRNDVVRNEYTRRG